jgi:hypothetical protein
MGRPLGEQGRETAQETIWRSLQEEMAPPFLFTSNTKNNKVIIVLLGALDAEQPLLWQ